MAIIGIQDKFYLLNTIAWFALVIIGLSNRAQLPVADRR